MDQPLSRQYILLRPAAPGGTGFARLEQHRRRFSVALQITLPGAHMPLRALLLSGPRAPEPCRISARLPRTLPGVADCFGKISPWVKASRSFIRWLWQRTGPTLHYCFMDRCIIVPCPYGN